MRAEVVEDQMDTSGRPVNGVDQVLREGDEVRLASMIGDLCNASTAERFHRDEHVAGPRADVLVVPTQCRSRHHRQARPTVVQQLLALLVHADNRFVRVPRPGVKIQQVVHPLPILSRQYAHAPHHFAPGLEAVFFSSRRIVSRLMSCMPGRRRASCSTLPSPGGKVAA